jgi:tol-pal system protein YbgF
MIGTRKLGTRGTRRLGSGALLFALLAAGPLAKAQQAPSGPQAKAPPAAAREAPGADAGLQRRVEQIEEQLVDFQVMLGTLESLARGAAPPPIRQQAPAPGLGGGDVGRLDAMETQIRALTAQLEHLQQQVRSLANGAPAAPPPKGGFGAVTVAPAAPPPTAKNEEVDRPFPPPKGAPPQQTAAAAPPPAPPPQADSGPEPQRLYEQAYGYMLQKDYGAAEQTFEDFLRRHPGHHLAGNAQYWLGETYFVRNQFKPAAAAFLKGYQDYAKSQKAPETLLKLAMSLQRLGQKDAACSSFKELATKFPNPPAHVRSLSQTERQRSGC